MTVWFDIIKYEFYTNADGVAYAYGSQDEAEAVANRLNRQRNKTEPIWRVTVTTKSTEREIPIRRFNKETGEIEETTETRGSPKGSSIFGRVFYVRRSWKGEPNTEIGKSVDEAIDELEEIEEEFDLSEEEWESVDDASDYIFEHKVKDKLKKADEAGRKKWWEISEEEYNKFNLDRKIRFHKGMSLYHLKRSKSASDPDGMKSKNHRQAGQALEEQRKTGETNVTYDFRGDREVVQDETMTHQKYVNLTKEQQIDYHTSLAKIKKGVKRPTIRMGMPVEVRFHREMLKRLNKPVGWLDADYTYHSLEEVEKRKSLTRETNWKDLGLVLEYGD
tara:strand:+ start:9697 stop:10695 length:999 start_codon:yes stop_codon:yes gene_type:complete